jgi:hypothetical protein
MLPEDLMTDEVVNLVCTRLRTLYGWTPLQTDKKKVRQVLWSLMWAYSVKEALDAKQNVKKK